MDILDRSLAITDIETSGLDPIGHEIIELGLVLVNQKTFDIYEDLYPSIQVFPGQATWHYNIKDPSDLSGLTGNGWKQNKNTDVSVEDDVSVAVEKLHREYPEALIDYYYEEFI